MRPLGFPGRRQDGFNPPTSWCRHETHRSHRPILELTIGAEARSRAPECTFDHQTEGVTPCGADRPNPAPRTATCRPVKINGIVPATGQRATMDALVKDRAAAHLTSDNLFNGCCGAMISIGRRMPKNAEIWFYVTNSY